MKATIETSYEKHEFALEQGGVRIKSTIFPQCGSAPYVFESLDTIETAQWLFRDMALAKGMEAVLKRPLPRMSR